MENDGQDIELKGDLGKTRDDPVIDGEVVEISTVEELAQADEAETEIAREVKDEVAISVGRDEAPAAENSKFYLHYIFLPFIFLTVTLLGGMRIGIKDSEFIFLKPALICLVFSLILLVLFFRANLIQLSGWFSEDFSTLKNFANGAILVSLFGASTQVFNSLIPEQGLPFWIIAFCFFWTLSNNLFAEFDTKRLLQSLGGLFGLAFVIKYLIFANLVSSDQGGWLQRIWSNPTQEAFTYFLDLPRFASATGYIQFFALVFYLVGLFLLIPDTSDPKIKREQEAR